MNEAVISARMPKAEAKVIDQLAKEEHIDRSAFVKKLLHKSLEEFKVERAFKLYKEGKASLGKAAEMAGKNIWEMIELMEKYNVYLNYSVADLKSDLKTIKELK